MPGADISVPGGTVYVEADAIGVIAAQVSPHAAVRQPAVRRDVKRREPLAIGLGDDVGSTGNDWALAHFPSMLRQCTAEAEDYRPTRRP